ncbi:metal-sensitive transcriptional regulator [Brachybacterium sp. p3-SID957]|nr:metal-sensitive transcriptional regulator [Brachybacterium sp. p3-SID957]MCT1775936.1 metal-sensitive transcriptional regulator [Brachybacterium sp. p3-SID957]
MTQRILNQLRRARGQLDAVTAAVEGDGWTAAAAHPPGGPDAPGYDS